MRPAARRALFAAAFLLGLPGPSSADIMLRQRESSEASPGGDGKPLEVEKEIALSKDRMRITDLSSGDLIIVRLDLRLVWDIPPGRGEYIEIPFDYLQKMSGSERMTEEEILENQLALAKPDEKPALREALDEARRRRGPVTAEERALRDSLAGEKARLGATAPEVTWSGRTARMIGYRAREAVLTVGGAKVAEVWVTDDAFFRDEVASYNEVMSSLGAAGGGRAADLAALGGFPLKTILFPVGDASRPPLVIEIVEARRQSFSPWDFDLPPGVSRASMLPPLVNTDRSVKKASLAALLAPGMAALALLAVGPAAAEPLGDNPFNVSARALPTPGDSLGDFRIEVEIEAPEGTYLYAERTAISIPGETAIAGPFFEKGTTKYDEFEQRELEIYKGQARARAHLRASGRGPAEIFPIVIVAEYQGCTSEFCYFPQTETLRVALADVPQTQTAGPPVAATTAPGSGSTSANGELATSAGGTPPGTSGGVDIAGRLATQGYFLTYLGVFVSGILLSFTPCVFPLIPITVGVIGARGAGSLGRGFGLSLAYVIGLALTYAVLGLVAAKTGALFGSLLQNPWVIGFVVTVFIALALSMFGLYEIQVPPALAGRLSGGKRQGVIGVFLMGIISGLVASPCVGPVILGLLVFIATTGSAVLGFTLLLTLGLGMGVLFLVIGTFSGAISALPRAGVWMDRVKEFFGVLLVAMAVYFLRPILAPIVFAAIAGVVLLVLASFGGVFEPGAKGWIDRIRRTVLLLFLAAGLALTGGVILRSGLVLPPPPAGVGAGGPAEAAGIRWLASEEEGLAAARLSGQPVLLDFTADWCLVCHEIDKEVLHDPRIIDEAKGFVTVRLDFTRVDDAARALQAKYGIRGLPAIVFLDRQGRRLPELTLTGLVPPEEFLARMRRAAG